MEYTPELIQGIVDGLEKEEKFSAKVGDKIDDLKAAFKKLRKSIDWMRILKITAKAAIPIAAAASTGGASVIIPLLLLLLFLVLERLSMLIPSIDYSLMSTFFLAIYIHL